ncbi:FecR domain-containing protein [Termitidicoccus mucosus]|uniref:FecR protein domain-containing protein n=1 Tax=Termitidicoccus mucosus TaxID=1184151 RepID=A0A178ILA6_9BACT|nr:hypothetical protein AW736_09920 [Opitutaceae bacterium TSB47]
MPPNHHAKKAFYALAARYLLDEASAAEREQLVQMLQEPAWREMFDRMSAGWNTSAANWLEGFDVEGEIEKVRGVVVRERPPVPSPNESRSGRSRSRFFSFSRPRFVLATTLSLAAIISLAILALGPRWRTVDAAAGNRTWVRQVNGVGGRMEIALKDGSKVTLNAGSQLSYPSAFDARSRTVRLTGEAFFDVAKDAARPFVVETGTLRITVLGTRFNVRAFADGTRAQVTLVSGKVQVTPLGRAEAEQAPVTLAPGMQYSLIPATGEGELHNVPVQAATGWMSDRIVWKDEPLPDAMRELERRHGIAIVLADPALARETVTARFQSETLPEIFRLLEDLGIGHRFEPSSDKIERVILSLHPVESDDSTAETAAP